ncbi:hypothetical protein E6C76_02385 [Pseudothauera nasutitermitis]|uniref:TadE-like protein n=1 Tax=Pseudothauera nasutitermitis TaxID=2565930 RepID=A0A4S4B6V3_9RHOO|nr:hypothetical protein E6C76_02385 [Pseudothauera nasutitermitis]
MNTLRARLQRGALAVEAAFVLPVVITGTMMFMELANIGLTIDMGGTALERALQQFRQDDSGTLDTAAMEPLVRQRMAAASHGYLSEDNIASVNVESFNSLDAMGGGTTDEEEDDDEGGSTDRVPIWRVTVDIRKDFITPLPRLLVTESSVFRYRYQQLLGYLPAEDEQ